MENMQWETYDSLCDSVDDLLNQIIMVRGITNEEAAELLKGIVDQRLDARS